MKTKVLCILLALLLLCCATVSAAPYGSYSYSASSDGPTEVAVPNAYLPTDNLSAVDLGVRLRSPEDLFCDDEGNCYVVDSKLDTLYAFDKDWNLRYTIDRNAPEEARLFMPYGVCVLDGQLYVADKGNKRIAIYSAADGSYIRSIDKLNGAILGDDFVFSPQKLEVSENGSIYVVADGALEGIIEISYNGDFYGYIGSNKTTVSAFELLWRRIFTEEALEKLTRVVPIEYYNIAMDEQGMIYTVTAASEVDSRVKKLNPSGDNVLIEGEMKVEGDYWYETSPSNFVDIAPGNNGDYYILDSNEGRVFAYDEQGNLLYLFGDSGTDQLGSFTDPIALETRGDEVLVLDRGTAAVTVFGITDYARLLNEAQATYRAGEYETSYEQWSEILKLNGNFSLAYDKAGYCQYRMHNWEKAMELFAAGGATEQYSRALEKHRQELLSANFGWVVLALAVVVGGIALLVIRRIRKRAKLSIVDTYYVADSQEPFLKKHFKMAYDTMFHPVDNFWNMRFEKRGSMLAATMFIFLFFLVTIFNRQMRGFIFNPDYGTYLDLGQELRSVAILFALPLISNWSVTTLMDGKGSARDIYCVMGYSLLPTLILIPLVAIVSQGLTLNELAYVNIVDGIAYGWTLLLMVIGIKEVHQYSWLKTICTLLLTVVAAAIILFICLLFFSLLQEIMGFVYSIQKEIVMRL